MAALSVTDNLNTARTRKPNGIFMELATVEHFALTIHQPVMETQIQIYLVAGVFGVLSIVFIVLITVLFFKVSNLKTRISNAQNSQYSATNPQISQNR